MSLESSVSNMGDELSCSQVDLAWCMNVNDVIIHLLEFELLRLLTNTLSLAKGCCLFNHGWNYLGRGISVQC